MLSNEVRITGEIDQQALYEELRRMSVNPVPEKELIPADQLSGWREGITYTTSFVESAQGSPDLAPIPLITLEEPRNPDEIQTC